MKPDYRTTLCRPHPPAASGARGLRSRIAAWWQRRLERREQRLRLEALAGLSRHLLQDIGVHDGVRAHVQAIRDARYDRVARSIADSAAITGRLVP